MASEAAEGTSPHSGPAALAAKGRLDHLSGFEVVRVLGEDATAKTVFVLGRWVRRRGGWSTQVGPVVASATQFVLHVYIGPDRLVIWQGGLLVATCSVQRGRHCHV